MDFFCNFEVTEKFVELNQILAAFRLCLWQGTKYSKPLVASCCPDFPVCGCGISLALECLDSLYKGVVNSFNRRMNWENCLIAVVPNIFLQNILTWNENQAKSALYLIWLTIWVSNLIVSSFPLNQHFRRVVASMNLKIFQKAFIHLWIKVNATVWVSWGNWKINLCQCYYQMSSLQEKDILWRSLGEL